MPDKKKICIQLGFCVSTKGFEEALNAVKFFGWLKKFGPVQNVLGPVKGQGISIRKAYIFVHPFLNPIRT